jgi:hypothetical protein
MRAYFFGNLYLSSIQQGIQAAHALGEMFIRYPGWMPGAPEFDGDFLWEWASNHKTMILLNGGGSSNIQGLVDFFRKGENILPWAEFNEEADALNGALTTVGIILPEKIYKMSELMRKGDVYDSNQRIINWGTLFSGNAIDVQLTHNTTVQWCYSPWEVRMIQRLGEFNLAS